MILFVIYLVVGFGEYLRVSEEYRENLYNDFPYHERFYLELSIIAVCLIFGPTLLLMKVYFKMKQFFRNLWVKITLPYRLYKFRVKMKKMEKEKDPEKATRMLFDAMSEIIR